MGDDRRLSAYIDEMTNTHDGSHLVKGWNYDLKQLKHYRWVRNRIVHEPNCTEANMCRPGDTEWIERFYSRIITQTDPLSLYVTAKKQYRINNKSNETNNCSDRNRQEEYNRPYSAMNPGVIVSFTVIVIVIAIIIAFFCMMDT